MKTVTIPASALRTIRRALNQSIKAIDLDDKLSTEDGPYGTESEREVAEIDAVSLCNSALGALEKAKV